MTYVKTSRYEVQLEDIHKVPDKRMPLCNWTLGCPLAYGKVISCDDCLAGNRRQRGAMVTFKEAEAMWRDEFDRLTVVEALIGEGT